MMRAQRGFSLLELVMAMLILTVVSTTFILGYARQQQFNRASEKRAIARIIGQNTIESLRAAGPEGAAGYAGTLTRVNSAGVADPEGDFEILIGSEAICSGGVGVGEDPNQWISSACANDRNALLRYQVQVMYPGGSGRDTLSYALDLSERGRFGAVRAEEGS